MSKNKNKPIVERVAPEESRDDEETRTDPPAPGGVPGRAPTNAGGQVFKVAKGKSISLGSRVLAEGEEITHASLRLSDHREAVKSIDSLVDRGLLVKA